MKKKRIALALAAAIACGTMTACSPAELMLGMSIFAPTMIGYVKKSKIQSSAADAKTVLTVTNLALAELDEEGVTITLEGWYDQNDENVSTDAQWQDVYERMGYYGDIIGECEFSVYISGGACVSAVSKNDKFGIYPGILSKSNYEEKLGKNPDFDDAKAAAEIELEETYNY